MSEIEIEDFDGLTKLLIEKFSKTLIEDKKNVLTNIFNLK